MFEHFGDHARRAVLPAAKDEAQRAGDRRIGTDHLLHALLIRPLWRQRRLLPGRMTVVLFDG